MARVHATRKNQGMGQELIRSVETKPSARKKPAAAGPKNSHPFILARTMSQREREREREKEQSIGI